MRGLLIVNPQATSTRGNGADLVARSLDGLVDLRVAYTRYRGHARELAASAAEDLVVVLGGDGAINEVVNGLRDRHRPGPGGAPLPLLAAIPGGGGNVFTRALGLPPDAAKASAKIRELLAAGEYRTIGLALAGERYFTFSAGLGMDAEVVHHVEGLRARGHRESQALFVRAILRRYYSGTDRRRPALTLERDGQPPVNGLFLGIVTNSAPWTYFRGRPLLPRPGVDFSSGLDVLALSRLNMPTILGLILQMMRTTSRNGPPRGRHVLAATGLDSFTIRCSRPTAFHVDGEYLGEVESVKFQFVPQALRVVSPCLFRGVHTKPPGPPGPPRTRPASHPAPPRTRRVGCPTSRHLPKFGDPVSGGGVEDKGPVEAGVSHFWGGCGGGWRGVVEPCRDVGAIRA
ncbi:MAG: diacylglycerol kinase family lipid kinase [Streptosporangiaceae bacterium]|nr:diacylglycerol kinase family lipid kinase [Streptosporangiaceae bacterium]